MKKLALLTASILASGVVVASPIYDLDEVQGGGTNVSGTNIRGALDASGLIQTLDNDAEVHMQGGGGNDVVIIQGELGGGNITERSWISNLLAGITMYESDNIL